MVLIFLCLYGFCFFFLSRRRKVNGERALGPTTRRKRENARLKRLWKPKNRSVNQSTGYFKCKNRKTDGEKLPKPSNGKPQRLNIKPNLQVRIRLIALNILYGEPPVILNSVFLPVDYTIYTQDSLILVYAIIRRPFCWKLQQTLALKCSR